MRHLDCVTDFSSGQSLPRVLEKCDVKYMINFTGDINFCELRPAIKIVPNGDLTADNDT